MKNREQGFIPAKCQPISYQTEPHLQTLQTHQPIDFLGNQTEPTLANPSKPRAHQFILTKQNCRLGFIDKIQVCDILCKCWVKASLMWLLKKKKKFDVYQNSHVNLLKYLVKLTQKTLLFLV